MVVGQHKFDSVLDRLKAVILATVVVALRWTWRVRFTDAEVFDSAIRDGGAVLVFWHGEQLPMVPVHRRKRIAGLASLSDDGELAAGVLHTLGFGVLRGSSSRGGLGARQACAAALRAGFSTALTVDGPRGPRHRVKRGAVRVSSEAGVPIIYAASSISHAWRLSSWDGFQVPLPGAKVTIAYGRMEATEPEEGSVCAGTEVLQNRMLALSAGLRA